MTSQVSQQRNLSEENEGMRYFLEQEVNDVKSNESSVVQ